MTHEERAKRDQERAAGFVTRWTLTGTRQRAPRVTVQVWACPDCGTTIETSAFRPRKPCPRCLAIVGWMQGLTN